MAILRQYRNSVPFNNPSILQPTGNRLGLIEQFSIGHLPIFIEDGCFVPEEAGISLEYVINRETAKTHLLTFLRDAVALSLQNCFFQQKHQARPSLRGVERLRGEAEANPEIPRFARNRLRNPFKDAACFGRCGLATTISKNLMHLYQYKIPA
jgi:hypothetical protein